MDTQQKSDASEHEEDDMAKELQGLKIEAKPERVTSLAKFSVRPQRFAFIIDARIDASQLSKIIEYNSKIWGGFYNLLLPCVDGALSEPSSQLLYSYDPDRIVFCGDIPEELRTEITEWLQPFSIAVLNQHLQDLQDKHDFFRPISMHSVFVDVERDLRNESESNIRIPVIDENHPWRFYAHVQLGLLPQDYTDFLKDALKATPVELPDLGELRGYLDALRVAQELFYPLTLTRHGLTPMFQLGRTGDFTLVFGEHDDVEALCLFWNSRMGLGGPTTARDDLYLFLPFAAVDDDLKLKTLAEWISLRLSRGGRIVTATSESNSERMQPVFISLKRLLREDVQIVPQFKLDSLPVSRVTEVEVRKEIAWTGPHTRFELPRPSFDLKWLHHSDIWIVDCDFTDRSSSKQSYFPPRRPGQKNLLMSETNKGRETWSVYGDRWRLSQDRIACQASLKDEFAEVRLPDSDQIFECVAAHCGFRFTPSEKCGYIRSFTRLLAEAELHHAIKDQRIQQCLVKLSEEGKTFTHAQLKGIGKFGSDKTSLDGMLLSLLRNDGLFQGVRYRCPHCNLLRWYQVPTVQSRMQCVCCKGAFQTPLKMEVSYSLNSLVALAIRQGAIPVALTEPVLKRLSSKTYFSTPGAVLTNMAGAECDIDIIASCDGRVVCVECKTLEDLTADDSAGEIPEQLARDYDHAKQLGASIFAVSVLSNDPPNEIRDVIRRANDMPCLPVAILITLRDMERGFLSESVVGSHGPANRGEAPISVEALIYRVKQNGFNA